MPNLPLYSLPPDHIGSITLTPLIKNASTGALTAAASPQSIVGILSELDWAQEDEEEDVRPVTSRDMNSVQTGRGAAGTLTTLRVSNSGQIVSRLKQNYNYVLLSYVEGTETYLVYFRLGRWGPPIRGRGGQMATIALRPVAFTDGTNQITRTSTSDPF